jgi:hypothetical protein
MSTNKDDSGKRRINPVSGDLEKAIVAIKSLGLYKAGTGAREIFPVSAEIKKAIEKEKPVIKEKNGLLPEIGDIMSDGTIFAGISPDNDEAIYAMPEDATLKMRWKEANDFAKDLDVFGHNDWRLPSKTEMTVLHHNRNKGALKGTFNENASADSNDSCYWSSSVGANVLVWSKQFGTGSLNSSFLGKKNRLSVRYIRSEPIPYISIDQLRAGKI